MSTKLYPLNHPLIKQDYPELHRIFTARPGYTAFKQMGLQLKDRQVKRDIDDRTAISLKSFLSTSKNPRR